MWNLYKVSEIKTIFHELLTCFIKSFFSNCIDTVNDFRCMTCKYVQNWIHFSCWYIVCSRSYRLLYTNVYNIFTNGFRISYWPITLYIAVIIAFLTFVECFLFVFFILDGGNMMFMLPLYNKKWLVLFYIIIRTEQRLCKSKLACCFFLY